MIAHLTQTPFPRVRECASNLKVPKASIPAHAGTNMCEVRYTFPRMREETFGTHNRATKSHTHSRICGIGCLFLTHSPSASLFPLTTPFFVPCMFLDVKFAILWLFDPLLIAEAFCFKASGTRSSPHDPRTGLWEAFSYNELRRHPEDPSSACVNARLL